MNSFDALLVVSFGGPEKHEDVLPFLENVLRGKNVPRERMLEVAEHYYHFEGRSPINDQNKELIAALEAEFRNHGVKIPVYWGNRNWHPLLPDTLKQMQDDGVRNAAALVTSAFGSYSGCRQYREDIARAQQAKSLELRAAMSLAGLWCNQGKLQEARELLELAEQDVLTRWKLYEHMAAAPGNGGPVGRTWR